MSAATANLVPDPTIERLEEQIGWYDLKSSSNMRWFKRIKTTEIVSAAVIPLLAVSHLPRAAVATGILGVGDYRARRRPPTEPVSRELDKVPVNV